MKGLKVTKIAKEIKFEGVWGMFGGKRVSRVSHSQDIWGWLWFSCGGVGVHCGKGFISFFQGFFGSINKILILLGGLDTRLSFYEVYRLS